MLKQYMVQEHLMILNSLSTPPLSWWRFEEGSGTTANDLGTGGNNGTLTNGTAYSTDVP